MELWTFKETDTIRRTHTVKIAYSLSDRELLEWKLDKVIEFLIGLKVRLIKKEVRTGFFGANIEVN